MTRYFLDSVGGSGTSPYDTQAKAAGELDDIIAVGGFAGGDEIYMDKDHVEPYIITKIWAGGSKANPVTIKRVDFGVNNVYAPTTGSDTINIKTTVASKDLTFSGFVIYGVYFEVDGHLLCNAISSNQAFIDCKYKNLSKVSRGVKMGTGASDGVPYFKNMEFEGTAIQAVYIDNPVSVTFDLCKWTGLIDAGGLVQLPANDMARVTFNNSDLSGITTGSPIMVDCAAAVDSFFNVDFINCKFPIDHALTDGAFSNDGQFVTSWRSDAGSDSFPQAQEGFRGILATNESTYLAAGYVDQDQATNLSLEMSPSSVCENHAPLESFDIVQWHDSTGNVTIEIECWDGFTTALQDDELALEVYYLDGTDVLRSMVTTLVVAGTPANIPTGAGAGAWTGEPSGRSIKLSSGTLSIGKKGWIYARVILGKYESAKSLFVNPVMTIT